MLALVSGQSRGAPNDERGDREPFFRTLAQTTGFLEVPCREVFSSH
jgi:hypothetical protein